MSDSTTITVSKPDDYFFYAYKGNVAYDYDGNGVINSSDFSGSPSGTFSNDFVEVTGSNKGALASFTGWHPGKAYTFAVRVDKKDNVALKISKIKSNDSVMDSLGQNRYIYNSTPEFNYATNGTLINVGWSVNIYAEIISPNHGDAPAYATNKLTAPQTNLGTGDKFSYDETSNDSANHRANYLAGSTTNNVVTLTNKIPLVSGSGLSTKDSYIFYSVYFSNENGTYFQEVDDEGTSLPIIPTEGTRYFTKVTTGNSNCYSGLSFALNELSLELS